MIIMNVDKTSKALLQNMGSFITRFAVLKYFTNLMILKNFNVRKMVKRDLFKCFPNMR